MVDTQHFCLRWNNYQSSITSAFENLRDDEDFVDVTLACDGKSLKAHRVVLSACSPYFRELLKSTPCKHPVIVLQDVAFSDLHALVEFIYHGEVNVHQRSLTSFLKTAEVLRVSGLTQNEDVQVPLLQTVRASNTAPSPHTPPHPAHTPHAAHTPSYTEKLEEALSIPTTIPNMMGMRRIPLPPRRISRSADNSPDVIKRPRHDNNNTEQPQIHDFSTKNHPLVNNTRAHESGNNGNGISNSSSSPSPRLMDEVKNEPLDMICVPNAEIDRSTDDTPPHTHHRQLGGGPPSRGSSAEADDRTPPPQLPPSPFVPPSDTKFPPYPFSMAPLSDTSLSGLANPLVPDSMASTSQGGARTPQEDYRCEPCNKSLSSLTRLKRHIQNVHMRPSREPVCNICRRVYSSLNSLRNHKSIYHRKQQPPASQGPYFPVN
ncbi:unnamed protein product [Chilo suppressalis]|uniref:Broad-Complex n=1 Tax=Chilo suppressalis TaxID=168631 RepID=A0ABN8AR96_CHISP|nr:hypothetical protein evm_009612 [Chilo suppressalis]CAH0398156.1 unnamed protein product [Chilo suppressalis]